MQQLIVLVLFFLAPAFSAQASSKEIQLSQQEQQWLKEHPVIKFTGDPNWLPYEAFDKQQNYIGIVSEHLKIIEQRLGIRFEKIPTHTWTESVNMAKAGTVDILSETDDSALKSHLLFTRNYLSNPVVIVMRNTENYVENLDKIKNKSIGVIKDYGYVTKIVKKYDYIDFITVEDIQDGLIAVSTGRTDALLCTVTLCGYTIAELGLHDVKIIGKTEFDTKLAFGVNKNLPELVPILNKAINSISVSEQQEILDRWVTHKYIERVDYSLVWKSLIPVLLLFITIILIWNRRLRNEIGLRRKIEEQLKEAKKNAEEAVRAKSEFLANMSHEIRTPMNGVLGMAELLEHSSLDEMQQQYLRTIQRSGNTLMVVINDILDYSKIEAGKMDLVEASFDLNDLVEETVVPYQLMPDSDVKFEVWLDPNAPIYLKGDAVRLHQIIANLLNNAFKFTRKGAVKLSVDLVEKNAAEANIRFCVSDTGVGIDDLTKKVLFKSFTQADQSTARKYGGTGLGLAICKRLIELMGGEITVESELGAGSSFSFCIGFPLDELPEKTSEQSEKKPDFSHLRVLLVEDNLVNQIVTKEFMHKLGVQSCVVSDGEAAVEMVCEHERPFDLILMDCEMPKMDGYEATKKIRHWESVNNKPATIICALTAHVLPEHITKCLRAGMDSHLAKPLKLNSLKKVLDAINKGAL